jgi:hypothetical protein
MGSGWPNRAAEQRNKERAHGPVDRSKERVELLVAGSPGAAAQSWPAPCPMGLDAGVRQLRDRRR